MDPQQRLGLELTWEALESANIAPSSLAGQDVGVFAGASALDYGNLRILDIASTDAYTATGNTLSIISNRISYAFDLRGPSFTVDTACSSSLVALDHAVAAIRSGRIDTAVVLGVNILASPFGFISFSQATMLSPTGLCRAFSADADGYVRSEGGVALVLRSLEAAKSGRNPLRAVVKATGVNSDGRTSGISLPAQAGQADLLRQVHAAAEVDVKNLAFVEAHGTGTPVGDPIEAGALGEILGVGRSTPLPIGSIKTNIGHTEPASGLAGVLKAVLALENDCLPASLHCDVENSRIDFNALNLRIARTATPLARGASPRHAGVSSFGFGGTNAHVVVADPPAVQPAPEEPQARMLLLSAQSRQALQDLAAGYATVLGGGASPIAVAQAAAHGRDRLDHRLAVSLGPGPGMAKVLEAFSRDGHSGDGVAAGAVAARQTRTAFVFSGNGAQWGGMGRAAALASASFRRALERIDAKFQPLAGWSLTAAIASDEWMERIDDTTIAQPLIFAIQVATVEALREGGLRPDMTLGHSVGEIAAAHVAGALSLEDAVRTIYARSLRQGETRGAGGMAILIGNPEKALEVCAATPGLEIAAFNSPRAVTLAGSNEAIVEAAAQARALGGRTKRLDLDYPFHSALMDGVRDALLEDLAQLSPQPTEISFISSVTGDLAAGETLGAEYWWRNVREPVRFAQAVGSAVQRGARVFVEIGPSPVLLSHIADTAEAADAAVAVLRVLDKNDRPDRDPFAPAVSAALVRGAAVDDALVFGVHGGAALRLPSYPWQRQPYRAAETSEASGAMAPKPFHPLIGARASHDAVEWRTLIDAALTPYLGDHRVSGHIVVPGAALVEMAISAAREWLDADAVTVIDFEISSPLTLAEDAARELLCRISEATGELEILSRPRLARTPWQRHARCAMRRHTSVWLDLPPPPPARPEMTLDAEALYARASLSGLAFGPAFRRVDAVMRDGGRIWVDLIAPPAERAGYGLHPTELDACFHGLIALFGDQASAVGAYLPVRFGEVRLMRPGAVPRRAVIDVKRANGRVIVADFVLLDEAGAVVAAIADARYQAVRTAASLTLAEVGLVQTLAPADAPLARGRVGLPAPFGPVGETLEPGPAQVLLDGWATALAHGLAHALADADGALSGADLVERGRVPARLRPWLENLLIGLEQSGLAEPAGEGWTLAPGATLPAPAAILRALAAEHPECALELMAAMEATQVSDALARGPIDDDARASESALEAALTAGLARSAALRAVADAIDRLELSPGWAPRVLVVAAATGVGPILRALQARDARISVVDPVHRRLERARPGLDRLGVTAAERLSDVPAGGFDLLVSPDAHLLAEASDMRPALERLAPGGLVVAVDAAPSFFLDVVAGLDPAWFGAGAASAFPVSRLADAPTWRRRLEQARFEAVEAATQVAASGAELVLLTGRKPEAAAVEPSPAADAVVLADDDARPLADVLAVALRRAGGSATVIDAAAPGGVLGRSGDIVALFAPSGADAADPVAAVAAPVLRLKALAEALGGQKRRLWILAPGALGGQEGGAVASALWAFARTLANEVPSLDVRRIAYDPAEALDETASAAVDILRSGADETDLAIGPEGVRVLRLKHREPVRRDGEAEAVRLVRGEGGGLDRLSWTGCARSAPGPGEIEIAVEAVGLNFRDVMFALSILPEEILENGFAGPTLGLECAGRVARVGAGVSGYAPGDAVVSFGRAGFASHMVVPANVVAHAPDGLTARKAATIPVAFLTAWYALVTCARLKAGETVLIHGGAGGVGLAALQIARLIGANVVATAGAPARRALVRAMGADHVFDSRGPSFADEVRAAYPQGVHVVLNSLAGEAMSRSIGLLRPFGRFVELGKRDYVDNTHIGLKPFARNLTYFGVDLDQLIVADPDMGRELFGEVMRRFATGDLVPLPYRAFDGLEIEDAFRLMQQSGHVGKIVVIPPQPGEVQAPAAATFAASPDRTHLITGGLGGFGLEAARWLADRGARHLALVGRSAPSPQAEETIDALRARGVTVAVEACDVADAAACAALLGRIRASIPPLGGIMHAAMVLDDAMVQNMDEARLHAVLRPKVAGAVNLDALSRADALDYFILFSSATTLIGNPGQGAYVAANGFMEGLARSRRAAGLPALAAAWGAIEDVGVLLRNAQARDNLAARLGIRGLPARAALDLLGLALADDDGAVSGAVLGVAPMNWGKAREQLPVLRSPSFAALVSQVDVEAASDRRIDVPALVAAEGRAKARVQLAGLIAGEVARILRLGKDDIAMGKPLAEYGLDSLMAIELASGLQGLFGLDAPLSAPASTLSVGDLADHVLGVMGDAGEADDAAARSVASRHLGSALSEAMEDELTQAVMEQSRTVEVVR